MGSDTESVIKFLNKLEEESNIITNQIIDICFFMKGGIEWDNAWGLCYEVRLMIIDNLNVKLRKMSGDTTEYM